jgi:hypothetical protein
MREMGQTFGKGGGRDIEADIDQFVSALQIVLNKALEKNFNISPGLNLPDYIISGF